MKHYLGKLHLGKLHLVKLLCLTFVLASTLTQAEKLTLPLSEIYPIKAMDLRCIDSNYDVQIPIPERWQIKSASLKFSYVNSASLLRKNSQLVVRLNGTPLAQMKLDPNAPEGKAEVDLPKLLLQTGYNKLSFSVSQHYAEQCESPCVPELWTRLNLDQAEISFEYDLNEVPLSISSIANFLFDPKNIDKPQVHLLSETSNDKIITLGAVVASGVALRYDYRPVRFTTSETLKPKVDNILIGSADYVAKILAPYDIKLDIDKPFIEVFHLPYLTRQEKSIEDETNPEDLEVVRQDPLYALIVITGKDEQQVRLAVESFDILSVPFPDSNNMQIHQFDLPKIALYSGKQMVTPGELYPFQKLNFATYTFRGFSSGLESLDFRVPPDFLIKPNQYVNVSLNFAYGAGFRVDSVLNVVLNGVYVSSIHLDNPRGALVSNYQLSLPTYLFKGGLNSIGFSPVLTPLVTENCSFIHAENLFLTLFDTSSFMFPEMPHQIELPRLDLLFVNGFPFTRWPDGFKSLIYLSEIDSFHLAAAYNMVGTLSQKNGYPLLGIELTNQLPATYDGELMMIGTIDKLPERFRDLAPLKFGPLNRVPYPVFSGVEQNKSLAYSTQKSELGLSKAALMQFQSPDFPGRSVVMLAAQNGQAVERLSLALQQTSVQSAVNKDLTLIDFINRNRSAENTEGDWSYITTTVDVGEGYVTGKGGEISPVRSLLTNNQALYWGLVVFAILLLSWLIAGLVKRQKNKRNPLGHDDQ